MAETTYIVCEFPNEENKISIGYRNWLIETVDDAQLQNIIDCDTCIQIRWPKNVNIGPKTMTMKKIFDTCTWDTVIATIHAFGGMYVYIYFYIFCFYAIYTYTIA